MTSASYSHGRTRQLPVVSLALSLLCILSFIAPSCAKLGPIIPRPANPFLDPKDDPFNPLKYITSNLLTAIAFSLIIIVAFVQSYFTFKWGTKFMLSMVIGEYTFALGIGTRFGLHTMPESHGLYIVEYLFVVLSPCAFIAANYVLLGRLARHLNCSQYLLVPASRITVVFISSDITTFLIQAIGGSLAISANNIEADIKGSHTFLAGLALQLLSYLTFTCIFLTFLYRVRKHQSEIWSMDAAKKWYWDWRALAGALFISCIGILIRSVYRTIELSQGFEGRLSTIEGFFYGLDTLPLFLAIVVYIPFWPGRFIPGTVESVDEEVSSPAGADEKV